MFGVTRLTDSATKAQMSQSWT